MSCAETLRASALVIPLVVALKVPAFAQSSPLSRGFATGSPFGGRTQVQSLYYYGPSYSRGYDRPPADVGQPYPPSLREDPFYGPDYIDRLDRGQRFIPFRPWYERFKDR